MAAAATSAPSTVDKSVLEFQTYLARRSGYTPSYNLASKTVEVMRTVITSRRWSNAEELMDILRQAGKTLQSGRPGESVVGNMVRRILRLVREEYNNCAAEGPGEDGEPVVARTASVTLPALKDILLATEDQKDKGYATPYKRLKNMVIQAVNDLLDELEASGGNIMDQALEHIHADEVIMTIGHSKSVGAFLKKAAKSRKFQVIIAEAAPSYKGHDLAKTLSEAGIDTTVITDSAIFAIMSRVNKVIIGTSAVLADGGLMTMNGAHATCMAAKFHAVPVLVCAAMYKLCTRYLCSYDQDAFNNLASPNELIQYSEGPVVANAQCLHPLFDYVPPELVTLFISDIGGNSPSYIYRLLSEYYHEDDYELGE